MTRTSMASGPVVLACVLAGCPAPIGLDTDATTGRDAGAVDARATADARATGDAASTLDTSVRLDATSSPDALVEPDALVAPDAFTEPDAFVVPDAFAEPDAFVPPECAADGDCDDGDPCNGAETCPAGDCRAGTPRSDGDACDLDGSAGTRELCLAGACAPTRCGDGFTDTTNMEQCDDANDVNGDGCDDCRFSCDAASDCDDGESCNGAETCSAAHVCTAGTRLANGTTCAGGTGRCVSGACLPNSCSTPADCADGDACNGAEVCAPTGCAMGTPPSCDDTIACTADACVSPTGCTHTLIDADRDGHAPSSLGSCGDDCNDSDAAVVPGATEICGNLVDDDCDGMVDEVGVTTWYADCDTDGYAAPGARVLMACAMPAPGMSMCASGGGWTARAPSGASTSDCNDGNASVNPAQTMYQTTAISGAPAASDYDYDCNTVEEPRATMRGMCAVAGLGCAHTEGWVTASAPACGASAAWITGCTRVALSCTNVTESRQQACR